jgi:hypothetical protein
MSLPNPVPRLFERLRADLEGIPGVRYAVVEGARPNIYVICDGSEPAGVELAVRARVARSGVRADQADIQIGYLAAPQPRRRVYLARVEMEYPRIGRAIATTVLEWRGELFEARMEGESGPVVELRIAALATIGALEQVLEGELTFSLVGIRALRAFDQDLVVALTRCEQESVDRPLVGISLATQTLWRGAALAVLNATNRLLGNYLAIED